MEEQPAHDGHSHGGNLVEGKIFILYSIKGEPGMRIRCREVSTWSYVHFLYFVLLHVYNALVTFM
jgi:hypothetical protein